MMLRLLNQAMRTSLKRMEYNDDRYEPDGRHSESPSSLGGQRQWYFSSVNLRCI